MRTFWLLCVLLLGVCGCGFMPGSRVRPGFRAEFLVPPVIRQESEFLVEESGQTRRAMPLSQTLPPWNTNACTDTRFAPADLPREVYRQPAAIIQPPPIPADGPTMEQVAALMRLLQVMQSQRAAPFPPPDCRRMPPATRESRED